MYFDPPKKSKSYNAIGLLAPNRHVLDLFKEVLHSSVAERAANLQPVKL